MALDNFNCPQFVDFMSNEAFDIHDGADFCFEKGVVGEMGCVDFLDFGSTTKAQEERRDSGEMERLIAVLKNSTNLSNQTAGSQGPLKPAEHADPAHLTSPKLPSCGSSVKSQPTTSIVDACENKENATSASSATPKKPIEIAPSISSIEACSAIQIATAAALRIEGVSGESTTIAACVTTTTMKSSVSVGQENAHVQPAVPAKSSGTKSTPLQRIRTNSNASSNDKASKLAKQSSTPSSSQSLVKKTIAKVASAFKTSSKPVLGAGLVDHNSLKSKLVNKKSAAVGATGGGYTRHDGPLRVEYEKPSAGVRNLSPTNQSSATNRRCSSVPRTLKEKQALVRAGAIDESQVMEHVEPPTATATLGEKIQNFFSSSHSNNLNLLGMSAAKNRQNSVKSKEKPVNKPTAAPVKAFNSSITTNPNGGLRAPNHQPDRRRSRSCNESIANRLKTQKSRTESGNSASSNTNGEAVSHSSRMNHSRTVQASPSYMSKPRQRSADRAPMLALYQGIKFVPKPGHKFPIAGEASSLAQKHQAAEDVLKTRPTCMQRKENPPTHPTTTTIAPKSTNAGIQVVAKLNTSSNSSATSTFLTRGVAKSSSFKQSSFGAAKPVIMATKTNGALNTSKLLQQASATEQATATTSAAGGHNLNSTVCLNANPKGNSTALELGHDSVLGQRNLNESASSIQTTGTNTSGFGWSRLEHNKKSSATASANHSGFLHTELRAQKRHEFELTLKEKDRLVANIKREMEAEKLRKQQEEIQKIRAQRTFRSRPIKHYKAVEIKPSEKPLTDPRSPQFGTAALRVHNSRTNLGSKQSSGSSLMPDVSALSTNANALLDAPIASAVGKMPASSSLDQFP